MRGGSKHWRGEGTTHTWRIRWYPGHERADATVHGTELRERLLHCASKVVTEGVGVPLGADDSTHAHPFLDGTRDTPKSLRTHTCNIRPSDKVQTQRGHGTVPQPATTWSREAGQLQQARYPPHEQRVWGSHAPWEDEGHGVGMVPMAARVQVLVLVTELLPRPYPQPARLAPSTARPSTTAFGEPGTGL